MSGRSRAATRQVAHFWLSTENLLRLFRKISLFHLNNTSIWTLWGILELANWGSWHLDYEREVKIDLFYTFRPGFVDLVTVETILRNKVATGWNSNLSQKQAAWSISRLRLRSLQGISDKQNARSFHCRSHNDSFIRLHNFSTKFSSCFSFWICSIMYLQN